MNSIFMRSFGKRSEIFSLNRMKRRETTRDQTLSAHVFQLAAQLATRPAAYYRAIAERIQSMSL
jgi:hypothetical protein